MRNFSMKLMMHSLSCHTNYEIAPVIQNITLKNVLQDFSNVFVKFMSGNHCFGLHS